jgi:protease-4
MNPIAMVVEAIANALRAVRNALASLAPAPEYVMFTVTGTLPERRVRPAHWLRRLLPLPQPAPPQESLEEWRARLEALAADHRVEGIVLKIGDLTAPLAALEDLRAALMAFRGRGKRVAAYLPVATLPSYYLVSAAELIVAPESLEWGLFGFRTEATFLRVALDRLGILPQYHHIAEYKSAANRFLYPQMPDAQREMLTSILESISEDVTAAIAESRQVSAQSVREAIDAGQMSSADAARLRLLDRIGFEDELPAILSADHRPATVLSWPAARARLRVPLHWWAAQPAAIAVVQLLGGIVPGESREFPVPLPLFGPRVAGSDTVARAFRAAERMSSVKAVVFHVDSPGGSAIASDLIWREVERVQRKMPVVVHMGNVAGSGGYYVACGARHIVAGATTLTGSIGVVSGKFDLSGLLIHGGGRREVLAVGESATMPSLFRPYTEMEWTRLRGWMDEVYVRFKSRVAAGRATSVDEVERIARGRVWTGRQALAHGLIDEIGDLQTAVARAKELAGIPAHADTPVLTIRPPKVAALPAASTPAAWLDELHRVVGLAVDHPLLVMTGPDLR